MTRHRGIYGSIQIDYIGGQQQQEGGLCLEHFTPLFLLTGLSTTTDKQTNGLKRAQKCGTSFKRYCTYIQPVKNTSRQFTTMCRCQTEPHSRTCSNPKGGKNYTHPPWRPSSSKTREEPSKHREIDLFKSNSGTSSPSYMEEQETKSYSTIILLFSSIRRRCCCFLS